MTKIERCAAPFRRGGKLRAILRNGQRIDRQLPGLFVNFEREPVFEERLHHGAVHACDRGVVFSLRDNVEGLRIDPGWSIEDLGAIRLLRHAIGEHAIGDLDQVARGKAGDVEPACCWYPTTTSSPACAVRIRFHRCRFECGTRRIGLGGSRKDQQECRQASIHDMSHNDILRVPAPLVKGVSHKAVQ